MREEPEDVHPVIEVHEDDAFLGKVRAVVLVLRTGAAGVAAAMDEDHHRQLRVGALGRRPDVDVQAVFAHRRQPFAPGVALGVGGGLHANG